MESELGKESGMKEVLELFAVVGLAFWSGFFFGRMKLAVTSFYLIEEMPCDKSSDLVRRWREDNL
jgi:hypothetical protein